MKPTLANYLDFLTPWISADLISPLYMNRIQTIAEQLPVLSFGAFECWLDAKEPRVDFNICINPRLNEHIAIRDWQLEGALIENQAYWGMRDKIRDFCVLWTQEHFFLKPLLGELSEVYDIADLQIPSPPVPWLYISFLNNFLDRDQDIKAEVIAKTLSLLDNELSAEVKEKFYAIVRSLPSSCRVGTIGINKRNNQPTIRLYLEIYTFEEVIQILHFLEWPGNIKELEATWAPWSKSCRIYGLAMDFDGNFSPKIGIEWHFHLDNLELHLSEFTQNLCDLGLCSIAKRKAVLQWNGYIEVETPSEFWSWPDRILKEPENIPNRVKIKKMLSYIKIIFEPDRPPVAKAYPLFLRPVLRTP